jgi:hypothetical protein
MKTSDLTGPALDWAVSRAESLPGPDGWGWFDRDASGFLFDPLNECRYSPSTIWAQGGPIIEREALDLSLVTDGNWRARHRFDLSQPTHIQHGPTPLIAAMRCYVQSKLGDTIDLPKELT